MPSIRIRDSFGTHWQIDSGNPVLVAAWLTEVLGRLCSANTTINHPVQIDVWPSYHYKNGEAEADWQPGGDQFIYRPDQTKKLHDLLMGIAEIPEPPAPPEPESPQFRKEMGLDT